MSTITERVALGEALMDERDPGWWREDAEPPIDLRVLDLGSTDLCVLGQRCPLDALADAVGAESPEMLTYADRDEAYAVNAVLLRGGTGGWRPSLDVWALAHGFTGGGDEMDALTAEWKRVIEGRRGAATTAGEENGNGH